MPRRNGNSRRRRAPGRNLSRSARAELDRSASAKRDELSAPPTRERRVVVPVKCPSGKNGYAEAVARALLEEYAAGESNRHRRPVAVYECGKCGAWHLTALERVDTRRAPSDPSFDPKRPKVAPPSALRARSA